MFDANVLLDVLLRRQPFADPAGQLLSRAEQGDIQGCVCANVVTTIFYLARKAVGLDEARRQVRTPSCRFSRWRRSLAACCGRLPKAT